MGEQHTERTMQMKNNIYKENQVEREPYRERTRQRENYTERKQGKGRTMLR
jgi:hypothetical protein